MTSIVGAVLRGSPRSWQALLAGVGAALMVLGMSAVCILGYGGMIWSEEGPGPVGPQPFNLVAEEGLQRGTAFALALMAVPALIIAMQVLRLAAPSREERYSALGKTGASEGQLRLFRRIETTVPMLVGAVVGIPVFLAMTRIFGPVQGIGYSDSRVGFRVWDLYLLPAESLPAWWYYPVGLVAVALVGMALASTGPAWVVDPDRERLLKRKRVGLLGLGLVLIAVVAFATSFLVSAGLRDLLLVGAMGCVFVGIMIAAPQLAYLSGKLASRSGTPALLIAASRLRTDPRGAGWAGAAVGAAALVVAGASTIWGSLQSGDQDGAFFANSYSLVLLGLIWGVILIAVALTVHQIGVLLDRRTSAASLEAMGGSKSMLTRVAWWEGMLAVVPAMLVGYVPAALVFIALEASYEANGGALAWALVGIGAMVLICAVLAGLSALAASVVSRRVMGAT